MSKDLPSMWGGISGIVSNIMLGPAGGIVSNTIYELLISPTIKAVLPLLVQDRDLQRAFASAFREATERLMKLAKQEDARTILQQLNNDTAKLFPTESSAFPNSILLALLTGDEIALEQSLWSLIERPYFINEPPDFVSEMKRRLPIVLIGAFGDMLKDARYQHAWVAFQGKLLQEVYRLLQTQAGKLRDEQQRDFARTLARLDILTRDSDLQRQMALTTAETLLSVWRVEELFATQAEGANAHWQTLTELLKQAINMQQARFDGLERMLLFRQLDRQALVAQTDASIFVSYLHANADFARGLYGKLASLGFKLWRDLSEMASGEDQWRQIQQAIRESQTMILVMSPESLASSVATQEWNYARQRGTRIIPVIARDLDWKAVPRWMKRIEWIDFREDTPERDMIWARLIRELNTPYLRCEVPFMVDHLPPYFVPRRGELEPLMQALVEETHSAVAITETIRGAGGYGKTTLARAISHDTRVRVVFDDGILWVTLGENPGEPLGRLLDLINIVSNQHVRFNTWEVAKRKLDELLADRYVLIVIDDVWNLADLEPFMVGGEHCARLITTRNNVRLPPNTFKWNLDAMTVPEAVALLGWELPEGEHTALEALAKRLGEWPLLLKLTNGALSGRLDKGQSLPETLKYVDRALTRKGLVAFDDPDNPHNRDKAVKATLGISLDLLSKTERKLYLKLAIFPEDIDVPLVTLEKLWGLDDFDTERLCERLGDLSLLLKFDLKRHTIRLHDVVRTFLRDENRKDLADWNGTFLDAFYLKRWHEMPNDEPYLWEYLAYHLLEAGREEELKSLFSNQEWMNVRVSHDGYRYDGYLADLDVVWGQVAYQAALQQVEEGAVPTAFADCMRYLLIRTSVNSLAMNYVPELVEQAVKTGIWTVERGLSIAEKIAEPYPRSQMYAALLAAITLNEQQLDTAQTLALQAVMEIQDSETCVRAIGKLAPSLQEDFLLQGVEIAKKMSDELHQLDALVNIARHLENQQRDSVIQFALEKALLIEDPATKSTALVALAPVLTGTSLDRAIETASGMPKREGSWALLILSQYLSDKEEGNKLLEKAFDSVSLHHDLEDIIRVLPLCASRLQSHSLEFALKISQASHHEENWLDALQAVAPYLKDDSFVSALNVAFQFEREYNRVLALRALSIGVPENLLERMSQAVEKIQDDAGFVFAAVGIANRIKGEAREELLQAALRRALDIPSPIQRIYSLVDLVKYFDDERHDQILQQCFTSLAAVAKQKDRNAAFEELSPLLGGNLLQRAIELSLAIHDTHYLQVLELVSSIAEPNSQLVDSVLEALPTIEDTHTRLWLICQLCPYLSGEKRNKALEHGLELCFEEIYHDPIESWLGNYNLFFARPKNAVSYTYRLRQLAPYLSEEVLLQHASDMWERTSYPWGRVYVLEALPSNLFGYVVPTVHSFERYHDERGGEDFMWIFSKYSKDNEKVWWLEGAVNIAMKETVHYIPYVSISERHWRLTFLASLTKHLELQRRREVTRYVLDTMRDLDEHCWPEILAMLGSGADREIQQWIIEAALSINREDYLALALASCSKISPDQTDLLKTIRKALIFFNKKLQYNVREDILRFYIDQKNVLFTPPIFPQEVLSAIMASITEICNHWKWI